MTPKKATRYISKKGARLALNAHNRTAIPDDIGIDENGAPRLNRAQRRLLKKRARGAK